MKIDQNVRYGQFERSCFMFYTSNFEVIKATELPGFIMFVCSELIKYEINICKDPVNK